MMRSIALLVLPALATLCSDVSQHSGSGGPTGSYYVSPSGDDGDPGTKARPFRTIQRAADLVDPGDIVIVMPGVYTSSQSPLAYVTRSGSATGWITFRSAVPLQARLDGQDEIAAGWHLEGS